MANSSFANMTMDELVTSFSATPTGCRTTRYFGVQQPGLTELKAIVLQQLPDNKKFLAVCPTVRFKEFSTKEEAVAFSQFKLPLVTDQNFKRAAEPRSPFPSPSQLDKDLLVAALSAGDISTVRRLAWKNPRLFVTPDDSPQCYRGTWRQTVLHLAVQAQNFPLFCAVVEVIENPVIATLTQLTDFEDLPERRAVIVKNFLNNRTKKEESPLDCAVIFGMLQIVDFLTVHPLCDLKTSRRTGQSLNSVVCSKCSADRRPHSTAIISMLEGRWYVPVYSVSKPFQKSVVGEPIPVDTMREALQQGKLAGFFGPISEGESRALYADWKRSQREISAFVQRSSSSHKRLPNLAHRDSDAEMDCEGEELVLLPKRASERIIEKSKMMALKRTEEACRNLAKRNGVRWKEWWAFLGAFVDIASFVGLTKLESFLADRHSGLKTDMDAANEPWSRSQTNCLDNLTIVETLSLYYSRSVRSQPTSVLPILPRSPADVEPELDDDSNEIYYTPPSSPEPIDIALDNFKTRYASREKLYIGGKKVGVFDYEVHEALKGEAIPNDFRYILAWRSSMENNLREVDLIDTMSRLFL